MNGDEVSGVTIMKMDEGLDTGDMLTKVEVPLAADETGAVSLTSSPQPEQNFWWRHFQNLKKAK